MGFNFFIHLGLGVCGFVRLIVPKAPVADQIDQHVVLERLAEFHRQVDRCDACIDVVGIDVNDRDVEAFGKVACIARRAAAGRIGRETDLVVRNDMERAAGRVPCQRLQIEHLGNDALTGERRVAVNEYRHGSLEIEGRLLMRMIGLECAGTPLDHRIDRLEMTGIVG